MLVQAFRDYLTQKVLFRRQRFAFPTACYVANDAFLTRIGRRWSVLKSVPLVLVAVAELPSAY